MGLSIFSLIFILVVFSALPLRLCQLVLNCTQCNNTHGNYTKNSTYRTNLQDFLNILASSPKISNGFYNYSLGNNSDKVYIIGICRLDHSAEACRSCLYSAMQWVSSECPTQKKAIGYNQMKYCTLRYSDRPIFGTMEDSPSCTLPQDPIPGLTSHIPDTDAKKCNQTLKKLLGELTEQAAAGDSRFKFANGTINVTSSLKIYALTQCTPDLSSSDCSTCLQRQIGKLPLCLDGTIGGGAIHTPSCMLDFENYPFITFTTPHSQPSVQSPFALRGRKTGKGAEKKVWIAIVVLIGLFILLATLSFCFLLKRKRNIQKEVERNDEIKCVDSLQFDYHVIEVATDNFSDAKRIVKGTSAVVYKGILPSGQEIAVKKMLKSGKDNELEFNNEVLLLANLQHRNLVKLLGFCLTNDTRFLVYEFLPNESLDLFIDDPVKRGQLDWETHHKIIMGIARGLLYLHEDSQLRVIHRDVKASNILLGPEMNPKISNFSRASRVRVDKARGVSSKVKGTYGYMPPEYALQGQFSTKSDVFSFGVLLLEIINGQTISKFSDSENEESLIIFAWRKWVEGEALDVVDKTMQSIESYSSEILKCIKIALLCVQEDPKSRPMMSKVVFMLNSNLDAIAEPSRPAFTIHSTDASLSSSAYSIPSNQGSLNEASISQLQPR